MKKRIVMPLVAKALLKSVQGFLPSRILIRHGPEERREIALTFDDGPHRERTPFVLDILSHYQVRATFFLVGKHAAAQPQLVHKIVDEGHEIGNHSQSHQVLTEISRNECIEEIDAGEKTLQSLTDLTVNLFRPPKGELSLAALCHLARKKKTTVLWSVDPKDFATEEEQELWKKLRESPLRAGDIILLHDRVPATATVLPRLIEWVGGMGLRFTTVGAMLG